MRRLLLISNSTSYGSGYLDHCETEIKDFLGEERLRVAFVPYASTGLDQYTLKAVDRLGKMGYELVSVHSRGDPAAVVMDTDAIFIGGGNTFLLLRSMYDAGLMEAVRDAVRQGKPYIGTSAGSNVACMSIRTTNDMPIAYPPSFEALGLVPFNINPHYIDPDPESRHKGETREERILQFHELNDVPVVGLRESAMLRIEGDVMELKGRTGARLFEKAKEPVEYEAPSDLSFLLNYSGISTRI